MKRFAMVLCAVSLLGACGDDPAPASGELAAAAQGDVQKGSISDAMIATDGLTSAAPTLEVTPSADDAAEDSGGEAEEAEAQATAETADNDESE